MVGKKRGEKEAASLQRIVQPLQPNGTKVLTAYWKDVGGREGSHRTAPPVLR